MRCQLCYKLSKEFTISLKVNWKYIYIGYKGYKEITPQLSKEEIIQYGVYLLEDKDCHNDLISQLVSYSQDSYEFYIILEHLQKLEKESLELQVRKWIVCLTNEMLNKLPNDYTEGLLELNEFWISLGQPRNCPHIYQSVQNNITPQEYYTPEMFNKIIEKHKEWIKKEVDDIKKIETLSV